MEKCRLIGGFLSNFILQNVLLFRKSIHLACIIQVGCVCMHLELELIGLYAP